MKESKLGPRTPVTSAVNSVKKTPRLGRDIQSKIGQQLRAIYDDVVNQGVPDRFVELLSRLDKRDDEE